MKLACSDAGAAALVDTYNREKMMTKRVLYARVCMKIRWPVGLLSVQVKRNTYTHSVRLRRTDKKRIGLMRSDQIIQVEMHIEFVVSV